MVEAASTMPRVMKPVHLKAKLFFNEEYEQLRQLEEYKGFCDLPDVVRDQKNVMRGLEGLSFEQSDVELKFDRNRK